MATRGVADDRDPVEIEVNALERKLREMFDASGDIVHCCRPASAGRSQPSVFQVPDGEAAGRQVVRDVGHLIAPIRRPPKPAVKQTHNGRSRRRGKVQVRFLADDGPVPNRRHH